MTHQMCLCGHRIEAPTIAEAWRLLEHHVDTTHGETFPSRLGLNTRSNTARAARRMLDDDNGARS